MSCVEDEAKSDAIMSAESEESEDMAQDKINVEEVFINMGPMKDELLDEDSPHFPESSDVQQIKSEPKTENIFEEIKIGNGDSSMNFVDDDIKMEETIVKSEVIKEEKDSITNDFFTEVYDEISSLSKHKRARISEKETYVKERQEEKLKILKIERRMKERQEEFEKERQELELALLKKKNIVADEEITENDCNHCDGSYEGYCPKCSTLPHHVPLYDPVCVLSEKPFSLWHEEDKKEFLKSEKPAPDLDVSKIAKWKDKSCVRKFKTSWYNQYDWLCGSHYLKKLFCLPCLIISRKSGVWNKSGFGDFGNVNRSIHKHESSAEHMRCALSFKRLKSNASIIQDALRENSRLFIQKFNENVRLNRRLMQLPIRATLYLAKQELSFRGLSNNRGNFQELLDTFVAISPIDIQEHYKTVAPVFTGNSKTIQNELIGCISEYIDEHIEKEIKECEFCSIQVDDITDIGQKSQCSIIIRYVIAGGMVKERFLGFFDISSNRSADTLFSLITSCLEEHEYKSKLVAQCYDGASVMSDCVYDLQAKIKQVAPQAVFVHCMAHRLDFVLQQSCISISKCRVFFSIVNGLPQFFQHSAKHTNLADMVMGRRVPTRWTSNSKILSVINNDWESLKQIFTEIIDGETSDQTSIRQSKGFLKEFNDFEFVLLTIIFCDIFAITDVIHDVLQKKSLDINYCVSQITNAKELLDIKRNRNAFIKLFETALSRTTLPIDHHEGHSRVPLTQYHDFEKYNVLYFEILDRILMQINIRFEDVNKIKFVTLMDVSKFETFSKEFPIDALNNLKEYYPSNFNDVQLHRLKAELQLIYCTEQYRKAEPQSFLKAIFGDSDVFKEAYRLFSLILTIPSTGASAERSFSCLKRIKTYLQSTTAEDRLTNLAKISIEKELLNELLDTQPFYDDIIDKFAALKNRRIELMFKK